MATDIIAPSEIQHELSTIWNSLERAGKTRASLFNLIFYTKSNERSPYIESICQAVVEKFPSRVLFITQDDDATSPYLNSRVTVASTNPLDQEIVCEQIQIDVAGKENIEQLPFLILPYILPDLPIYVIWADDPSSENSLLEQLKHLATRLIFDTETVEDLAPFAQSLLNIEETLKCDVADLNWARIESWRDLLTSTFYTQERLDQLKKTKSIQILYNGHETPTNCRTQFQAILLQSWLASQLGWKFKKKERSENKTTYVYDNQDQTIEISLHPEYHPTLKPGIILSIDIDTQDQEHFSFGRNLHLPHHVSMRLSTLEKCDIPLKYIFAKDESGQSLVKEICHKGTSNHYLNLLHTLLGEHCES